MKVIQLKMNGEYISHSLMLWKWVLKQVHKIKKTLYFNIEKQKYWIRIAKSHDIFRYLYFWSNKLMYIL